MWVTIFPGGSTLISMPEVSTSLSSVKESSAAPPPNSSRNICPKFWLIWANRSVNCWRMCFVKSWMSSSSWALDFSTSSIWPFKNWYRSETSRYSTTAPTFTAPGFDAVLQIRQAALGGGQILDGPGLLLRLPAGELVLLPQLGDNLVVLLLQAVRALLQAGQLPAHVLPLGGGLPLSLRSFTASCSSWARFWEMPSRLWRWAWAWSFSCWERARAACLSRSSWASFSP